MKKQTEIEEFKENFKDHEIIVVTDNEHVKKFIFKKPGTGTFEFSLVTADNLIAMTGDCYSLMITPGYGRCGFSFLRGSVNSVGYFLGKCPFNLELTKYSYDEAIHNIRTYVEEGYINQEDLDDVYNLDEGDLIGENNYYKFCNDHEIYEPSSPRVLTATTLLQLAGLQCFVEKYNERFL